MKKRKLVVIGLDGATWKVINPLLKKGKLPFLRWLRENSAYGTLKSIIPPLTPPAWVSFQTGVNPGKHGIFGFLNYRKNPADPPLFTSKDVKATRLWDYLARFGIKSLVINMPLTYPLSNINGVIISSFDTPPGKIFIYPKKYKKILQEIDYKIDLFVDGKYGNLPRSELSYNEKGQLLEEIINISRKRALVLKRISEMDQFSLFFVLFKEVDIVQHLFWGENRLVKYFRELDKILSEVFLFFDKKWHQEIYLLILSDHGFHKISRFEFSIYRWLKEKGYIKFSDIEVTHFWRFLNTLNSVIKKTGINPAYFGVVKKFRRWLVKNAEEEQAGVNYERFGIRASFEGLYFDKDLSIAETVLIKELRNLRYKGKKVFELVKRSENLYKGEYLRVAPNIIWIPNQGFNVNISPLSSNTFSPNLTNLKGDHISDRNGVVMVYGSNIRKKKKFKANIEDIFPLICRVLGVEPLKYIEGKIPKNIFKKKTTKLESVRERIRSIVDEEIQNMIEKK